MSINDIDQSTALLDLSDRVHFESVVPWEVHHVELNVLVVVHKLCLNRSCWEQEESLVRRHLLEYDLGNRRLARSKVRRKL